MKIILWNKVSAAEQKEALKRPTFTKAASLMADVGTILSEIKENGDKALRKFSLRFDGIAPETVRVSPQELAASSGKITPQLMKAIQQAKKNIAAFHEAGRPQAYRVETMPGVVCELQWRPIETVGFYIPGGSAPLFSTVLMLAIPARLAGCKRMVLCAPPQKNGGIHPAILAAAVQCGIEDVYAVGGAQAIAAMAYGTETVPKVDKICGPGNPYVTAAKQLVSQDPDGAAIDLPAGPSEVMIIADAEAEASLVAADMLAQAEHDTLAQAFLVTTDAELARRVQSEIEKQLIVLSRRAIAEKSIEQSRIIVVSSIEAAIEIANAYAPEHLILHHGDAAQLLPQIKHAGSVFVGRWTPESAGDYASGTNHVLPTYGYARAYGGLSIISFLKSMTVQTITSAGLENIGPTIVEMAEAEGLDAHAAAVKIRYQLKSDGRAVQ